MQETYSQQNRARMLSLGRMVSSPIQWEKHVGEISETPLTGRRYEWVLLDFFSLSQRSNSGIVSQEFKFKNNTCSLGLWPCFVDDEGVEWIGLNLWIHPDRYPVLLDLSVKLGILDRCGEEYECCSVQGRDEYEERKLFSYEKSSFLTRSKFVNDLDKIAPYGVLTVFCEIRTKEDDAKVATQKCTFSGPEFWAA